MNWDAVGSIGEIIGAFGVIVSLVYLATQIRQNSTWLKSTIVESAGVRTGDLTATVYSDAELCRIASIGFSKDAESLELEEKTRFTFLMARALRNHEVNFAHFKAGLMDEESFEAHIQNMTVWTSSPLFDAWWKSASLIYRKDFREKVEEIRKKPAGVDFDQYTERLSG